MTPEVLVGGPAVLDDIVIAILVDGVRVAVQRLNIGLADLTEGRPLTDLLHLLHAVRTVRIALAEVESGLESTAARADWPKSGKVDLGDLTAQRRGGSKTTRWDTELLAPRLINAALVDHTTGEELGDRDTAERILALLLDVARPEWRTTRLKANAVPFGDCRTTEPSRRTVQITSAAEVAVTETPVGGDLGRAGEDGPQVPLAGHAQAVPA